MRQLTELEQRATNGGWCLRSTYPYSAIYHYYNGYYMHTDYYRYKVGAWYYYY